MSVRAKPEMIALVTSSQFDQASALYRRVFGYTAASEGINPKLMSSIVRFGGTAVGAVDDGGDLIAFAYGFTGLDAGEPFHFSQAAVVAPEVQGQGLGRALKRAQRAIALGNGLAVMRWTYDPWIARNAHFNLDVLGATATASFADYYGTADAAGLGGTHRVIVGWDLRREPRVVVPHVVPIDALSLSPSAWATLQSYGDELWAVVPADSAAAEAREPGAAEAGRARLRETLAEAFSRGYEAVSCQRVEALSSVYRLAQGGSEE